MGRVSCEVSTGRDGVVGKEDPRICGRRPKPCVTDWRSAALSGAKMRAE